MVELTLADANAIAEQLLKWRQHLIREHHPDLAETEKLLFRVLYPAIAVEGFPSKPEITAPDPVPAADRS